MAVIKDPEGREISSLHAMVDFKDRRVLEVGCGEGRLTWLYAGEAAAVTAIDPILEDIETARANTPQALKGRVTFLPSNLADFAQTFQKPQFDIAIFSWSL